MFGFDFSEGGNSGGLLARGKAILALLIQTIQNRLELASTEIQEEYERLWPLLVWMLISIMLLGFALFFLSLFIIICFWDTHRLAAAGAVAGFYLISATLVALYINIQRNRNHKPFKTTLEELGKDLRRLQD